MPPYFSHDNSSLNARRLSLGVCRWRDVFLLFLPAGIIALAIGATVVALGASSRGHAARLPQHHAQFASAPRIFLWAWARPENLTYIDTTRVGVAYFAGTIHVSGEDVGVRPRMQPLRVPAGTTLIAVVRIESDARSSPSFSALERKELVEAVRRLTAGHELAAVQIDFDARYSERTGYRLMMKNLRDALPTTMPLQMTALASWCMHDDWIESMPVDEAVPMFFNMGADTRYVDDVLRSGLRVQQGLCGSSVGLATYEASDADTAGKRVYWFTSGGWTKEKVKAAEER